jgi:bifunctional DNA-binding transcriptional regulator/antitoxin component of YhaV-PrlF toxin-antitoxin module
METTRRSSKGQVVPPKSVRAAHGWAAGTAFVVDLTPDGVRLRVCARFPRTGLAAVFGSSVKSPDRPRMVAEMDEGIRRTVAKRCRRAVKR